jgi:hypothetical protein
MTSIAETGKRAIKIVAPWAVKKRTRIGSAVWERSTIQRFFLALVIAT